MYLSCRLFGSLGLPREVVEPTVVAGPCFSVVQKSSGSQLVSLQGTTNISHPNGKVGTSSSSKTCLSGGGYVLIPWMGHIYSSLCLSHHFTKFIYIPRWCRWGIVDFCFEKRMLTIVIYRLFHYIDLLRLQWKSWWINDRDLLIFSIYYIDEYHWFIKSRSNPCDFHHDVTWRSLAGASSFKSAEVPVDVSDIQLTKKLVAYL